MISLSCTDFSRFEHVFKIDLRVLSITGAPISGLDLLSLAGLPPPARSVGRPELIIGVDGHVARLSPHVVILMESNKIVIPSASLCGHCAPFQPRPKSTSGKIGEVVRNTKARLTRCLYLHRPGSFPWRSGRAEGRYLLRTSSHKDGPRLICAYFV